MSLFICPICEEALEKQGGSYRCAKGHSFDISQKGHVNLLPVNRKNSAVPGDDPNMVRARRRFLERGYYAPLREAISRLCLKYSPDAPAFFDSGCGEGYYTHAVQNALCASKTEVRCAGVDISKSAVMLAAKLCPGAELAVASAYHLPLAAGSINLLLNCFSPLCLEEFRRVLALGGHFFYVVPGPRHLWELKSVLYDTPYENSEEKTPYEGFEYSEIYRVSESVRLSCKEDIQDLFQMTPYFWKTPEAGKERLSALSCLETQIEFDIHVYEKISDLDNSGGEISQ
ncbi:MAG: methyltransferase domain-containing protein [Oscillospiraceae bacterium]